MRPESGDAALLWDMLDAARAVSQFTSGRSYADYMADRMFRGAVERHVEIIGETAGRVSKALRDKHPEIPWHKIIVQRHVLVHEYGDIKHDLIWKVATVDIPQLIGDLEPMIPPPPESDTA
jgi:uncharacterized protein with HEPN domain